MIVDANVIVSASLGKSQPLVLALLDAGHSLLMPDSQMREARLVTATRAAKVGRDSVLAFAWAEEALFSIPLEQYRGYEAEARQRLPRGTEKDWPLVALALASGEHIWSNDRDLFGIGIPVWNTQNISRSRPRPRIVADLAGPDGNDHA